MEKTMKIVKNKAMEESIKWIENNPYTEEIISISDVKMLREADRMFVPIFQGEYPVYIAFTPMQEVEVTYRNKYFGVRTDKIIAGFDAVQYKEYNSGLYTGVYMAKEIIDVVFIGEYARIISK